MKTLSIIERFVDPSRLTPILVLMLASSNSALGATEVPIDFFVDFQSVADVQNGAGVLSNGATSGVGPGLDASILGGQRDMQVDAISGAVDNSPFPMGDGECGSGDSCAELSVAGGLLTFANAPSVVGTGVIQWDGSDQSITLEKTGLQEGTGTGVDLTHFGLSDRFVYTIQNSDQGFNFTIEAYTNDTEFTIVNIPATEVDDSFPLTREILFASLENPAFCGAPPPGITSVECGGSVGDWKPVDFSNLGAFQIQLNVEPGMTAAVDLEINKIIVPKEEPLGCRLTGGGVTEDYTDGGELFLAYDGSPPAEGETMTNGGVNRYQMHGQVGARTALGPQPWGEWSHSQQSGPAGKFVFHAGTRSAPAGTEIVEIRCDDPSTCFPSGNPPSPLKQLDFDCIGTFKSIANGKNAPAWLIADATVTDEGNGNRDFDGTFHYCEVNVDDLGEGPNGPTYPELCPVEGFGEKSDPADPANTPSANCDCPDFYRLTIYNGVDASTEGLFLPDGNIDQSKLDKTNVIYEVDAYLQNGNGLQIHDLTGFDK